MATGGSAAKEEKTAAPSANWRDLLKREIRKRRRRRTADPRPTIEESILDSIRELFAALPDDERRRLARPIPTTDLARQHGFYRSPVDVLRVSLVEGHPHALLLVPRRTLEADCIQAFEQYCGEQPSRWVLDAACELRLTAIQTATTVAFRSQSSFTPYLAELPSLNDDELVQITISHSVDDVRNWLMSVVAFASRLRAIGSTRVRKIVLDQMQSLSRFVTTHTELRKVGSGALGPPPPSVPQHGASLPIRERRYRAATSEERQRAERARREHTTSVARVLNLLYNWLPPARLGRPATPVDDSSYVRIARLIDEAVSRFTPGFQLCRARRKAGGYESDDARIAVVLAQMPKQQYGPCEIECILSSGTVVRAAYRYIALTDPDYRTEGSVKQAVYEGRKLLAGRGGTESS